MAARRARRPHRRQGFLREVRPLHHEPGRPRQRTAGLPGGRGAAATRRVRHLPHRPMDRRSQALRLKLCSNNDGKAMPEIRIVNPDTLGKPLGQYSQMTRVKASEFLFIAGQVGVGRDGKAVGVDDFDAQCVQTFANIEAALKSAGAGWANVVEFTTYLVHSQDIAKFMAFRLREFPKMFPSGVYPPNTLLIIDRLVHEEFLVEVQTTAAL